jgi:hypothetical protein
VQVVELRHVFNAVLWKHAHELQVLRPRGRMRRIAVECFELDRAIVVLAHDACPHPLGARHA